MNRKIKAYQAIIYIVLFYLAAVLFLLGPGKLLEKDRLLAGAENPVGTVEVREDQQVQQVLIAEGDYLRYLELYVTSPKSPGEYYHLLVYDENNEMLICLQPGVTAEHVEQMAAYQPKKIVLASHSLADSSAKANAYYLLENQNIELKTI